MTKTICLAGKNRIAISALQAIIALFGASHDVVAVANLDDTGEDGWQPSYRKFVDNFTEIDLVSLEDVEKLDDAVFISAEFDRIIRPDRFSHKSHLFNIHFSFLPSYKGVYTSAHPILNGEKTVGCTLHEIDWGIDTGPIIDQCTFALSPDETAKTLYAKYIRHGEALLIDNLEKIVYGNFSSKIQSAEGSTYYSRKSIDYHSVVIDLNKSADEVRRQICAFNHRSFQLPQVFGETIAGVRITNTRSRARPGTILARSDDAIVIATVDYDCELIVDAFPALIAAVSAERETEIRSLVGRNAFLLEESCKRGWTPLMVAAYNNKVRSVETLLDLGADPRHANQKGTTPLMFAKDAFLASGDAAILRALSKAGADPEARDLRGLSLFDYVSADQGAAVRAALADGA